jgi:hypothetical protein
MLDRLRAFLRPDRPPAGYGEALAALDRRVSALEAAQADCAEVVQLEAERAARWADMSAQLRRFLGRLDAHAGKDREPENGTRDPKQLAAILRTKFPNAGV